MAIFEVLLGSVNMTGMGPIASVRRRLRHVRSTSNNCRDDAVPRTAERCQEATYAVQQIGAYSISRTRDGGLAKGRVVPCKPAEAAPTMTIIESLDAAFAPALNNRRWLGSRNHWCVQRA